MIGSDVQAVVAATTTEMKARIERLKWCLTWVGCEREWVGRGGMSNAPDSTLASRNGRYVA
jgi:hypothetical protein